MKLTTYIRISKNKKVSISLKPKSEPLHNNQNGRWKKYYPTIQYKINIDIPDKCFEIAEKELNLSINTEMEKNLLLSEEKQEILSKVKIEEDKLI